MTAPELLTTQSTDITERPTIQNTDITGIFEDKYDLLMKRVQQIVTEQIRRVEATPKKEETVILHTHKITINNIGAENWVLTQPIEVIVEERKDGFIACFYDIHIYGYGDSIPESLDDLKMALVNQYEFLLSEMKKVKLGSIPQKQLDVLKNLLSPKK